MLEKWLDVPLFVGKEEHLLTAVVMKNYHRVVAIKVGRRARSREEKVAAFVPVAKLGPSALCQHDPFDAEAGSRWCVRA